MNPETTEPRTWPSLAGGLFDALTGRRAEITYDFDDLAVTVPSKAGDDAVHALWKVSGTLRIRTSDETTA